jgi:hypothetical protein
VFEPLIGGVKIIPIPKDLPRGMVEEPHAFVALGGCHAHAEQSNGDYEADTKFHHQFLLKFLELQVLVGAENGLLGLTKQVR